MVTPMMYSAVLVIPGSLFWTEMMLELNLAFIFDFNCRLYSVFVFVFPATSRSEQPQNVQDAIQDTLIALDGFLNNRFTEAKNRLEPW